MTSSARPSRFARNTIANGISLLFAAVVGFFLSPYIVKQLGPTQYGVWMLIAGLVGYLGILDLGIRAAVNRYTARLHAMGDHQECSLTISAALRLFGFLGILAIALSGVIAYFVPILFNVPAALADDARIVAIIGGLGIATALVAGVFGAVVTGLERFDTQCGIEVLVTSVRTVAIILALRAGCGLVAFAGIQLFASVLSCALYWVAAHKLYKELRIQLFGALGSQTRTILHFSVPMVALSLLGQITNYSDNIVIGAFLPIEAVTFFAIAANLCLYAKGMPTALSHLMIPRISALTAQGSNQVGETILSVTKFATLISAPMAVTFALRGESFITLWMGPAFGPASGEVLRVLAIIVWLDASRNVAMQSLIGMSKQRTVVLGIALEAACYLALSLALVQQFGIVGVALGSLVPNVLSSLGYIPRCLSRATGISAGLFFRNVVLLPAAACLLFGVATALIERFVPATSLAIFFLQTFLILPLVPLSTWLLCLSTAEKSRVNSEIGRFLRR